MKCTFCQYDRLISEKYTKSRLQVLLVSEKYTNSTFLFGREIKESNFVNLVNISCEAGIIFCILCLMSLYSCVQKSLFEDVALGTIIVSVSAKDADSGLFSVIEYGLVDGEGKFGITPTTVCK